MSNSSFHQELSGLVVPTVIQYMAITEKSITESFNKNMAKEHWVTEGFESVFSNFIPIYRNRKSSIISRSASVFFNSVHRIECTTVVSEKKGTFICELIVEHYIYLRNTQKHLKLTNYVRNKSFLEFYQVYDGVCLKLLGTLL